MLIRVLLLACIFTGFGSVAVARSDPERRPMKFTLHFSSVGLFAGSLTPLIEDVDGALSLVDLDSFSAGTQIFDLRAEEDRDKMLFLGPKPFPGAQ